MIVFAKSHKEKEESLLPITKSQVKIEEPATNVKVVFFFVTLRPISSSRVEGCQGEDKSEEDVSFHCERTRFSVLCDSPRGTLAVYRYQNVVIYSALNVFTQGL